MKVTEQNRRDETEAPLRERRLPVSPTRDALVLPRRKIKRVVLIVLGVLGSVLVAVVVVSSFSSGRT